MVHANINRVRTDILLQNSHIFLKPSPNIMTTFPAVQSDHSCLKQKTILYFLFIVWPPTGFPSKPSFTFLLTFSRLWQKIPFSPNIPKPAWRWASQFSQPSKDCTNPESVWVVLNVIWSGVFLEQRQSLLPLLFQGLVIAETNTTHDNPDQTSVSKARK